MLPDGRKLRREVHAGSSYLSSEDPRIHFGLGGAAKVRELVVRWPGGGETRAERCRRQPPRRGGGTVVIRAASFALALAAAALALAGCFGSQRVVPGGGLRARRPRGPFGRAGLGRGPPGRHPARHAGADRPRSEPLPHLGRDVGRVGCLRPRRRGLLRGREARVRRRPGGTGGGHQLRGLPAPPPPLLARIGPAGDLRRAHLDHGLALLPDRLHDDRGRLPGGAREPHRGGSDRVRA